MLITAYCPACAEDCECEVLADSRERTVRCLQCGNILKVKKEKTPGPVTIRTIVSHEGGSAVGGIEMMPDDECSVDDRLVAECGDEAFGVQVTSIETGQKRVNRAKAKDITALWTRVIDEVVVRFSIHSGRQTIPLYKVCDGEEFFTVGEVYSLKGKQFRLTHLKLRDGPLMRKEGWKTVAHRIKRAYGTVIRR
ncbi:MAG TPA: HVO_0476 family zinc finger protein [Methanoregulaceae archaeon]|nr:HVO_0476 family zinc finger protein [Methanoregulaceae archaeon]HPD74583.1 HVO_0476 family zinc finger protein [Methanoregulaceae archaeon]HRY74855.1 HVO_0476 family zinc finger protein [Methanoregulaceae archaeon]